MNNESLIWTKSQCMEAFDDLLIKIAMSSFAELEGGKLSKENEQLKRDPEFQLPPDHEKIIRHALKKYDRKKNFVIIRKAASKIITRVAVVFLILTIGFSVPMTVSAEFRRVIYNLFMTTTERYTQIESNRDYTEFVDSDAYISDIYKYGIFAPTVMPTGYHIESIDAFEDTYVVVYTKSEKWIVFFQQRNFESSITRVDTENAQRVETVIIGESKALLVVKRSPNGTVASQIIWNIGDYSFHLASEQNNPDELIVIAKNIKLTK